MYSWLLSGSLRCSRTQKKICTDFQLFQKVKVCLLGIRDDKSGEESTYIAREFSYLCIEFLTELRHSAVHCIVTSKYFNYMRSWSLEVEGRVESCKWKDRFSWELRRGSDAEIDRIFSSAELNPNINKSNPVDSDAVLS